MTGPAVAGPLHHVEQVMGTVFSFSVRDAGTGERRVRIREALRAAVIRLHELDAIFSTYRPDSPISRLGRGETALEDCDPQVAEVLERCLEVSAETGGWFTDHPGGRLDPSGWVKGWAVQEASDALRSAGSAQHSVTGGGDVQTAGEAEPGRPWRIGITDPLRADALAAVVAGRDLAVATSGVAERGAHIIDPYTGRPAQGLHSLTLVGSRLARTDAWATAAFAMGAERGLAWVEARPEVEALAVLPDGSRRWTPGFARYAAPARVTAAAADWRSALRVE